MRYSFDNMILDADRRELVVDEEVRPVEPLVFELLLHLVKSADVLVTKNELFEHIWSGKLATDASLSRCIKQARHALGDDGEKQLFIKTMHGRGFRFIADVTVLDQADATSKTTAGATAVKRWAQNKLALAGILLLVGVVVIVSYQRGRTTDPIPEASIAVLPFDDLSSTGDQKYFADGVAEEILTALAKVKELKVAGRTSSFSIRDSDMDIRQIGKMLSVVTVLEGSVRRQGNRVRVKAQLINTKDGYHLWSESYDRAVEDIFVVQDDIANEVTHALRIVLAGKEIPLIEPVTTDVEAYRLYLRARALLKQRYNDNIPKAIGRLEEAITLDPRFASAYAGLATAHVSSPVYTGTPKVDAFEQAIWFAEQALRINDSLAEPHAVIGLVLQERHDWVGAEHAYRRAIDLLPGDSLIRTRYARLLRAVGHLQGALEQIDKALEVDPAWHIVLSNRSNMLFTVGRYDEAAASAKEAIALGGLYGYQTLGELALLRGDSATTIEYWMKGWRGTGAVDEDELVRRVRRYRYTLGRTLPPNDAVEKIEDELVTGTITSLRAAYQFHHAGAEERAMKQYESIEEPGDDGFVRLLFAPTGKSLRQQPYFPAFAEKIGLMDYWREFGFPDLCRPVGNDGLECD